MFGSIGMPELIIILVIALIIFGPRKLPELGRSLGKSIGEFRKASNELKSTLEEEIRLEEQKEQRAKMEAEQASAVAAAIAESCSAYIDARCSFCSSMRISSSSVLRSSFEALLNSLMLRPSDLPSSGSLRGPKMMRAITKMITSSGMPIEPNM